MAHWCEQLPPRLGATTRMRSARLAGLYRSQVKSMSKPYSVRFGYLGCGTVGKQFACLGRHLMLTQDLIPSCHHLLH